MHPLLRRQLRKCFPGSPPADEHLDRLVAAVDEAYAAADDERVQLERSLNLASAELYERNRRLESELEERKRLEIELRHAEKLRAVGGLAAGIAHEINTPVQYIGDSIAFLSDAFDEFARLLDEHPVKNDDPTTGYLREEVPRAIHRCAEGVEQVATIVRALKVLSYPDAREQEPADVHAAIENTLIVAANELKYVADVDLDLGATRTVRCHVGEIQQVMLNLLVNAAHAIADRVGNSGERGIIRVTTRDDGPTWVVTVADDGVGIPDQARDRIFEPFFTTKPMGRGTGQGLALARSMVVDRHGGQISFSSTVGKGTTFTVRLPVEGYNRPSAVGSRGPS